MVQITEEEAEKSAAVLKAAMRFRHAHDTSHAQLIEAARAHGSNRVYLELLRMPVELTLDEVIERPLYLAAKAYEELSKGKDGK